MDKGVGAWQCAASCLPTMEKTSFWIRVAATSSNLQLFCTPKTPVKGTDWMDVWPSTLPSDHRSSVARAVWKQWVTIRHGKRHLGRETAYVRLTGSAAIGSQHVTKHHVSFPIRPMDLPYACESLSGISFPGLPNLLWSTTCLVSLHGSLKPEVGQVVSACYCRS